MGFARVYGMVPQAEETVSRCSRGLWAVSGPGLRRSRGTAAGARLLRNVPSFQPLDLVNLQLSCVAAEVTLADASAAVVLASRTLAAVGPAHGLGLSLAQQQQVPLDAAAAPRWRPPRCRAQVSGRWRGVVARTRRRRSSTRDARGQRHTSHSAADRPARSPARAVGGLYRGRGGRLGLAGGSGE